MTDISWLTFHSSFLLPPPPLPSSFTSSLLLLPPTGAELFRRSMWSWLRFEKEQIRKDDAKYKDRENCYLYPTMSSKDVFDDEGEEGGGGSSTPAIFSRTHAELRLRLQTVREKVNHLKGSLHMEKMMSVIEEEGEEDAILLSGDGRHLGHLLVPSISSFLIRDQEDKDRKDGDDDKDEEEDLESQRLMQKRAASRRMALLEGFIITAVFTTLTILATQKWLQ